MSDEFFHNQMLLTDPPVMKEFHAAPLQLPQVGLPDEFFRPYLGDLQSFGLRLMQNARQL
jgi:hypothetical protein